MKSGMAIILSVALNIIMTVKLWQGPALYALKFGKILIKQGGFSLPAEN